MRKLYVLLLAGTALTWTAAAQTTATSQTSVSTKTKARVTADKSGTRAQSDTSAAASQQTQASSDQKAKKGAAANSSASGSAASSTSASAGAGSVNLSSGTTIEAVLSSSLDARKNKEGDQVVAKTTKAVKSDGKVVIPKNSKLIGHVTEAKTRAKGESDSMLSIAFDRAVLKNGQEIPVHIVIQALAAAETATSAALEGEDMGGASAMGAARGTSAASASSRGTPGGVLGGVSSTAGATASTATNVVGGVASTATGGLGATANTAASATGPAHGTHAVGELTSSSTGVIGLEGLRLNSEVSHATQGSVIASSTKNVRLESGTRMVLRVVSK